jgi:multidrug transporter EmrE-like cation transporter
MAGIDASMLGLIKGISQDGVRMVSFMIVPTIVYAIQPWIFLSALKTETMTVMNLYWDLSSDVLVSLLGILYFKEKLGLVRSIGLALGVLSLSMLSYKGDDD